MSGDAILLDSNFIINLLCGKIEYQFEPLKNYAVSIITKMEVMGFSFPTASDENMCRKLFLMI